MHSQMTSELWDELKRYINVADREEAADILITVLINHDESIADIQSAFGHDADIKRVLSTYVDDEDITDTEDYDEDSEDWDR